MAMPPLPLESVCLAMPFVVLDEKELKVGMRVQTRARRATFRSDPTKGQMSSIGQIIGLKCPIPYLVLMVGRTLTKV